jgi:hypothetical protein
MKRPVISIAFAVVSLGFGATASRALGIAPENVLQGESGVAAGSGRAALDGDSSRRLPAELGATKVMPDSVFGPDSALPEPRPVDSKAPSTESFRHALTQPGCGICLEGSGSVQWVGSTGSFHVDGVGNYRASGTSGTLDLRIALSSSPPVFGQGITYYTFTDIKSLSPLAAGYHYTNVNSGTVNFYPSSIPAGQYWMFLYLREFQGSGTWSYTDFMMMNAKASCNGVSCTTVATCTEDAYTMCLVNGRYQLTSQWKNQYTGGTEANLFKAKLTDYTGAFWFANASTYEYMIRISTLTDNGRAWIAIPTFTDVEFWITVTDMINGQWKDYHSLPGNRTLIYDPSYFIFP